jgi:hypothetical protein
VSEETRRVILSGSDYSDHWRDREPYDARPYSPEAAWPTGRNVYDVPREQYDRWVAAKKGYARMQDEIRALIRDRNGI